MVIKRVSEEYSVNTKFSTHEFKLSFHDLGNNSSSILRKACVYLDFPFPEFPQFLFSLLLLIPLSGLKQFPSPDCMLFLGFLK